MSAYFYVVNMQGLKPTYYTAWDYTKALKVYNYLHCFVTPHVSLRRVPWQKVIKDGICRGLN